MTPEQYFLKEEEKEEETKEFHISKYKSNENGDIFENKSVTLKSETQEVILFVGAPGSGKSTFWSNYLSDYVRVNNDTLKTAAKCI